MKAFIFDFDGVIVDSELHWDKLTLDSYKRMIPTFTREDDKLLKGRSIHDIYPMMVEKFGLTLTKEEYMTEVTKLTTVIYGELCKPLPGLRELIGRLRARGLPTGIASSSQTDWIESTLKRLDLEGIFSPIVTAQDVGIGKPDPAVYLETARLMGCAPGDCIALEDSTNGVRSAKDAGMTCIGLTHAEGYVQDLSAADTVIGSMDEITDELLARFGF